MCSQTIGVPSDCVGDIQIDFTSPVSGLWFLSTGDDAALAAAALVDVYVNFVLAATIPIATDGAVFVPPLLDLSAFSSVTRIVIRDQVDSRGLGFDDFNFTADVVPEPATILLLGAGLGAVAARRHFAVRTETDVLALAPEIRRVIQESAPGLAARSFRRSRPRSPALAAWLRRGVPRGSTR